MAYSQWTTGSRSAIKRFAHNARIDRAIDLLALEPGDRILDYGMGDGMLLRRIHQRQPGARLCGFEPRISQEAEAGTADIATLDGIYDSVEPLGDFGPTKIACLEVLEHLRPAELDFALSSFRRLLARGGLVVASVPVEIGPASVVKNAIRVAINQPHRGINPRNVMLSLFGLTGRIERDLEEPYIASHIGFDYRVVRRAMRAHGFDVSTRYSPFPGLGPLVSSQVLLVSKVEEADSRGTVRRS